MITASQFKQYQQIYDKYKDFFKKYGININNAWELRKNPWVFDVIKRYDPYNHPKHTDLDVSKLVSPPSINSILGGVLTAPNSDTVSVTPPMALPEQEKEVLPIAVNPNGGMPALPISGMYDESAVNTDTDEPSGKVVVGPDTEVPVQPVQATQPVNKPNVASVVKPPRRAPKPGVVNDTPVPKSTSTPTPNVSAPTLSSVATQAVRHNGGFDNYRRESVLSALRAAGGISPAEAVQRGIIPWEALNYV